VIYGDGNGVSLAGAIATLGEVVGVQTRLNMQPVEAGDVRDTWADIGRAVDLIGYRLMTKLAGRMVEVGAWPAGKRRVAR
jgi:UDP-glucose 4-epimerase